MSKFNVGDKVKYIGPEHDINPQWFPIVGTIGTVAKDVDEIDCYIQWPKGSTSKEDRWYCNKNDIELVENEDMTNEEIWKMLESKMRKNGLVSNIYSYTKAGKNGAPCFYLEEAYKADDVRNAIALAYKVGYLRSQKGRPFKIGEKKEKGGHWVPVDPNNLPKEGTRVKYTRECRDYKNKITLGRTGIVRLEGPEHNWFGISLDDYKGMYYNWLSFDGLTAKSLDMWVEDDE